MRSRGLKFLVLLRPGLCAVTFIVVSVKAVTMIGDMKANVNKELTFDNLELRVGRVITIQLEESAPKKAYRIEVDFGKFGKRVSVGRFTLHSPEEIRGKLVIGVLNFGDRQIGSVTSQCLILGAQFPKGDSGEATFLTPVADAKIGGKIF